MCGQTEVHADNVVPVCFSSEAVARTSAVLRLALPVDATGSTVTAFAGHSGGWRVPVASMHAIPLLPPCKGTKGDLNRIDAAAVDGLTPATPSLAAGNTAPARQAACGALRRQVGLPSKSRFSMSLTSLMSFLSSRWVSAAEFTTKATTTNIPYELDAHRTGLCSWASSSLTTAFVSLVCAWLAVEAEMATRAPSFVVCSAVVVRHTFFTTALCACVDFASAQVPLCTMWLLLPLIGFSLEGLVPPRVWRTLIACFIPMSSTALSGRGATPAFPALLWVTSAVAH